MKVFIVRVYIVEDSGLVRERLIDMLAAIKGLEIIGQAEGERAALEAIEQNPPDAVILDLQLADGSGFEVLRKVKLARPAVKVIILTNHATTPYRKKCLQGGADAFFDKTTEFEQVVDILKKWIRES